MSPHEVRSSLSDAAWNSTPIELRNALLIEISDLQNGMILPPTDRLHEYGAVAGIPEEGIKGENDPNGYFGAKFGYARSTDTVDLLVNNVAEWAQKSYKRHGEHWRLYRRTQEKER